MKSVKFLLLLNIIAFTLTYIIIFPVRKWAIRKNILDIPDERSSHIIPTPTGGGVVIFTVTAVIVTVLWSTKIVYPRWWLVWPPTTFLFFSVGVLSIVAIGWLDDLKSLSIKLRFSIQCLAALLAIKAFGYWHEAYIPLFGQVSFGWVGLPLTFLWIVGLTNAYNFMDGINGMAGGQGVLAGLGWALIFGLMGMPVLVVLATLLASTCLAFLIHNWSPARIFMGDAGSSFLGYMFAILPVIGPQISTEEWTLYSDAPFFMVGILLVWPFCFDTAFTFLRRLYRRENVLMAHRSHLYQRLVISGYRHETVTLIYMVLSLICLLSAVYMVKKKPGIDLITVVALLGTFIILWTFTLLSERKLAIKKLARKRESS